MGFYSLKKELTPTQLSVAHTIYCEQDFYREALTEMAKEYARAFAAGDASVTDRIRKASEKLIATSVKLEEELRQYQELSDA